MRILKHIQNKFEKFKMNNKKENKYNIKDIFKKMLKIKTKLILIKI